MDAPVQPDGAATVAAPPPLLLVGDNDAGHLDAGLRPPHLHPFRQPLGRVTAEPGHEGGPDVSGLLRSRRRGHVQPAAAQLRLPGLVRMHLQAIVQPEIEDGVSADELPRRRRRVVRLHVPQAPDDPVRLPAHDRIEPAGGEILRGHEQHVAGRVHRHRHRLLSPGTAADGDGRRVSSQVIAKVSRSPIIGQCAPSQGPRCR